ncbi:MAG: crossover junction endodeoxyribonuclease RuvC [Gammaproteobacteria bacterium]|nr:MAG: crossover junction endodeoxyribonuclease RuvC [Gammaproteobacteria bacterium]
MRILGVDPGSRMTGVGIIEVNGDRVHPVYYGAIKAGSGEFTERLGTIFSGLQQLIKEHRPDEAAIETVFVAHNAASAIKLGQARGAAVCAAISCKIPVSDYSPRSIKQAIAGRGGADKTQVQYMVGILLGIKDPIQDDAADALAVALCHQATSQTLARMAMMQG